MIHHGKQFQVMTNEPSFEQQRALLAYWQEVGGQAMLPGTDRPADRFVRASFYLANLPQTSEPEAAVAGVASVMRNVSVPFGIATPSAPNVAATQWRTIADQKHLVYYFDETTSPDVFWVDLAKLDLSVGQPVRKLVLEGHTWAGESSQGFKPAPQFAFMRAGGS